MSQLLVDPNLCCGSGECIKVVTVNPTHLDESPAIS